MYAGHLSAQLLYQLIGLLAVDVPVHGAQHVVGAVLQGDVESFLGGEAEGPGRVLLQRVEVKEVTDA